MAIPRRRYACLVPARTWLHGIAGHRGEAPRWRRPAAGAWFLALVVALAASLPSPVEAGSAKAGRFDTLLKSQAYGKTGDRAVDLMLAIDGPLPPSPGLPTTSHKLRDQCNGPKRRSRLHWL